MAVQIFVPEGRKPEGTDGPFWEGYEEADLGELIREALVVIGAEQKEVKKKRPVRMKRGNISGLAKHLMHKHGGDPKFFTKCVADDELAGYDEETRKAVCAKAHKLAIGRWPGEDPDLKTNKKECCKKSVRVVRKSSRR